MELYTAGPAVVAYTRDSHGELAPSQSRENSRNRDYSDRFEEIHEGQAPKRFSWESVGFGACQTIFDDFCLMQGGKNGA